MFYGCLQDHSMMTFWLVICGAGCLACDDSLRQTNQSEGEETHFFVLPAGFYIVLPCASF
jgi:hypothetical protein